MTTELPKTLYTAIGVFQTPAGWTIEVAVPNFPTHEDAEAYAPAFRIRLVEGRLLRDDGKGTGVFDESWREVLDSQVTLSRIKVPGQGPEPVALPIAQWHLEPGLGAEFEPAGSRVELDPI